MKRFLLVQLALLFVCCFGCGSPTSNVHGTVTIDCELANQGTVQFHPVQSGPTAYGTIAKDGSYTLRIGQGNLNDPNAGEVPVGEYIVTVVVNMPSSHDVLVGETGPPHPGARLTPAKYGDKQTSDLRCTVNAGTNVVPLELEGVSVHETTTEEATPTADEQDTAVIGKEQTAAPLSETDEQTSTTPTSSSQDSKAEDSANEEPSRPIQPTEDGAPATDAAEATR